MKKESKEKEEAMLSEKEKNIMQALLEDEITSILGQDQNQEPLFGGYYRTLSAILQKIKADGLNSDCGMDYPDLFSQASLSRQAV